jgi:hypothetical protein
VWTVEQTALVCIAAYALDEGEMSAAATDLGGGHSDLMANPELRDYPGAPNVPAPPTGKDQDAYITQAAFRAGLRRRRPRRQGRRYGRHPAPGNPTQPRQPLRTTGLKTIPSWYLVAHNDKAIPPEAERFMAARAHAHRRDQQLTRLNGEPPRDVTKLILSRRC